MATNNVIEDGLLNFLETTKNKTWIEWLICFLWAVIAIFLTSHLFTNSISVIRIIVEVAFAVTMKVFTMKLIHFAGNSKRQRLALIEAQKLKNQEAENYTKLMQTSRRKIHCLNCDHVYNGPLKEFGCPTCHSTLAMFQTDWTAQVSGKTPKKKGITHEEVQKIVNQVNKITSETVDYKGYTLKRYYNGNIPALTISKNGVLLKMFQNIDKNTCLFLAKAWCDGTSITNSPHRINWSKLSPQWLEREDLQKHLEERFEASKKHPYGENYGNNFGKQDNLCQYWSKPPYYADSDTGYDFTVINQRGEKIFFHTHTFEDGNKKAEYICMNFEEEYQKTKNQTYFSYENIKKNGEKLGGYKDYTFYGENMVGDWKYIVYDTNYNIVYSGITQTKNEAYNYCREFALEKEPKMMQMIEKIM